MTSSKRITSSKGNQNKWFADGKFEKICAKPFVQDFDEQLDACENAFPSQTVTFFFCKKDVEQELSKMADVYDNAALLRVRDLLYRQMRKYAYLF